MSKIFYILTIVLFSMNLVACSGSRQPQPGLPATYSEPLAAPLALPLPSELVPRLTPNDRGASYTRDDLFKYGNDYSKTLPRQLVAEAGNDAAFTPAWAPGGGLAGLAYAMFDFTVPGYGGNAAVYYELSTPQTPFADVYIGLANWDTDSWSWYPAEADWLLELPAIDPFLAFGDKLLVCIAVAGTAPVGLNELRIGSIAPYAFIRAESERGVAPWTVTFNAGQSQDEDGTIVEYRWDLDSSGDFAISTGTVPTYTIEIADPGEATMNVRVYDDDGVYGSAAQTVTAWDSWIFSLGSEEALVEQVAASTFAPNGNIVLWGSRSVGGNSAVMRIEMTPGRDFTVATWDGPGTDVLTDACDDGEGGAWICGYTDSYGQGGNDGLLQHWDSAGQLTQSWVYGLPVTNEEFNALVRDDLGLYVGGTQFEQSTLLYTGLLLYAWTGGGIMGWCNEYKSAQAVTVDDLALDSGILHLAGTYTPSAGDFDALYLRATTATGGLAGGGFFGNTTDDERGTCVLVGNAALPGIWIGGTIATSGVDHSFVACKDGPGAELGADFTAQLNAVGLVQSEQAPLTLVLQRRATLTDSTLVLADLDNTLSVMPTSREFQSSFTALSYPQDAVRLGANGLLVTGSHSGQPVSPVVVGLNAVPTTRSWRNMAIEIGHPVLISAATDTTQIEPGDSFDMNRGTTNGEALIMLWNYNALPST